MTRRHVLLAAAAASGLRATDVAADAREDRKTLIFEGRTPNKLVCDTTLRAMPDGSWVMVMLGGGDTEPLPANNLFIARSHDEGKTWSQMEPIRLGIKEKDPSRALVPTELMVYGGECRLFFANHDGRFRDWTTWVASSRDSCRTWGRPEPVPEPIHRSTFIRNTIILRNGEILVPYQHYVSADGPKNPRNGVMISKNPGRSWTLHGSIRISEDDAYRGFAENAVIQLADGRLVMLIRADKLGGVLFRSDSTDNGRNWTDAVPTDIPNPGSKVTLYAFGKGNVALLHNPNPKQRNPLSLWVSFDGMRTWPYRRDLDNTPGRLNYPDGFVSTDGRYLHFAYDENRFRAVYYGVRLPRGAA